MEFYTPGQNTPLWLALGCLLLVGLVYGGLYLYRGRLDEQVIAASEAFNANEAKRNKPQEQELLKAKEALALVQPLLASHVHWSAAFTRVQRLVDPEVQFDSLSTKLDKNEYAFKATAASYAAIARQIAAFYSDDAITDVTVGKLSTLTSGRIEFTVQLTLDPAKTMSQPLPSPKP